MTPSFASRDKLLQKNVRIAEGEPRHLTTGAVIRHSKQDQTLCTYAKKGVPDTTFGMYFNSQLFVVIDEPTKIQGDGLLGTDPISGEVLCVPVVKLSHDMTEYGSEDGEVRVEYIVMEDDEEKRKDSPRFQVKGAWLSALSVSEIQGHLGFTQEEVQ